MRYKTIYGFQGDVFEFKIVDGAKVVTKHESKFENIKDANIIGAYATVKFKDGSTMSDIIPREVFLRRLTMFLRAGMIRTMISMWEKRRKYCLI